MITSYNRNFTGRLDGNMETNIFIASPEMVVAKAFAGDLRFNPELETLTGDDGHEFSFSAPYSESLPESYENAIDGYMAPAQDVTPDNNLSDVYINPDSDRLQTMPRFPAWDGKDYLDLPILIKIKGKCTTDHITPGGPWFRYRGHLDNISNNTFIGAVNADSGLINSTRNVFTGEVRGVAETARDYKERGQQWVVIAEHNYGEGSSREHAALQPRFLHGVAVIAKSLPRLHETNLKRQGMLPLTFIDESDYDRIDSMDRISLVGLDDLQPGKKIKMLVSGKSGQWSSELGHSLNEDQILFFKHGSALNLMRAQSDRQSLR